MKIIEQAQQWFHQRGPRERIYLFILGLILIYALCMILFIRPQMEKQKLLTDKMNDLQTKQVAIQQQIDIIHQAAKGGNLSKMIADEKKLMQKIQTQQAILSRLTPELVSTADLSHMTKAILLQQNENVDLTNLRDFPAQPWPSSNQAVPDITKLLTNAIYQHDFQIEFNSDYFSTLAFLQRLEKLPWPIYWDALAYTVTDYPKAHVIVKLHVLTN